MLGTKSTFGDNTMFELITADPVTGAALTTPLPFEPRSRTKARVRLRTLLGASAVHVAVCRADGKVRFRGEIKSPSEQVVPLELGLDDHGLPAVHSPDHPLLRLTPDDLSLPLPAVRVPAARCWDLAFLVDGTACPVIAPEEAPRETLDYSFLAEIAETITDNASDLRVAVVAFGDHPLPGSRATDLAPRYLLDPCGDELRLTPSDGEALVSRLAQVPHTPGGDYVDALAEGLEACTQLTWRPDARRLVIVAGDSPGHALLHPFPLGADALVRALDVDHQAARLHRRGVLIATIDLGTRDAPAAAAARRLRAATSAQYARLASVPALALSEALGEARALAARLAVLEGPIGRGASLGVLVDLEALHPSATT